MRKVCAGTIAPWLWLAIVSCALATRGVCKTDADCSYNGNCKYGACECFPQWTSAHCATLNLVPTARDAGYQPVNASAKDTWAPNISTWGGQALYNEKDGKYHM
jgi:hypothetical protein